jgi:diguanylate cyclase (GGDEF)-like protein
MNTSILIIDDSKKVRQEIVDILKSAGLFSFFFEAADGIEGFKMVLEKTPDIILCDIEMPGMDGFTFLRMRNTRNELQSIPVIMVTGREESASKIQGLELGASDYVTKPFDPGEFLARIKVQLKIKTLQDQLKKSNEMLLELSRTDPLTGLHNRRQMMEILEKEMERSKRTGDPLSLILIDVDNFKKINDIYGHQRGDQVLKNLGRIFRKHLRQYDSVARFGGEEFSLIMPSTDCAEAFGIADRVRQEVAQMVDAEVEALKVTISLGVAVYFPGQVQSSDDLIRKADFALYRAKQAGRNRVLADQAGDRGFAIA